ncbi:MAG: hypothetical protein ACKVP7_07195 [Hyphomicrobiaceae bacterium]
MAYLAAVNWLALLLFAALVMTIAMFGLSLSGHFPAPQKRELKDLPGRALLIFSIVVVAFSTAKALGLAMGRLPPPVAVIGAGAALLAAPLALKKLPDSFVDGRLGIVTLAAIAAFLSYFTARFPA